MNSLKKGVLLINIEYPFLNVDCIFIQSTLGNRNMLKYVNTMAISMCVIQIEVLHSQIMGSVKHSVNS